MRVSRVLSPGLGAGSVLSAAATLLGDFRYLFSLFVSILAFLSRPAVPKCFGEGIICPSAVTQCLGLRGFALLSVISVL